MNKKAVDDIIFFKRQNYAEISHGDVFFTMKRDFIGKAVFLVAFVVILVVSVYGFSGRMMSERHDDLTKTNETTAQSTDAKTTEETNEKPVDKPSEKSTDNKSEKPHKGKLPSSDEKLVCFTFDDGPYAPVTSKILDTLKKYDAKATFFVVGDRADTYSKSIERAAAMGCEIGTHTYSHVNLNTLSAAEMQEEISKSCAAISKYSHKKVSIIRPPEGAANDTVKANIGMPMVMWSVDSRDWDYRNADRDYQTVMDNVFDGSIVLMHDLYPATAEAFARLVPELKAQGYKFVTFSELMEIRGVDVEAGEKYFSATPQTSADDCE